MKKITVVFDIVLILLLFTSCNQIENTEPYLPNNVEGIVTTMCMDVEYDMKIKVMPNSDLMLTVITPQILGGMELYIDSKGINVSSDGIKTSYTADEMKYNPFLSLYKTFSLARSRTADKVLNDKTTWTFEYASEDGSCFFYVDAKSEQIKKIKYGKQIYEFAYNKNNGET